ncbi:hypothetical protein [Streptomyces sp. NPDC058412]|uniref:hypothetical protein n=1 Tax=Streptomyces sp. NPDC058412 TaxID=3346486 RepID=UPI003659F9AB
MRNSARAVKVVVPAGVALLVAGVSAGGWSLLGQNDSAPQGAGSVALGPVAAAQVGDPGDVATWRLPLEAYQPTAAQTRTIASARDGLIDRCMADAGFPNWTPAPDLPPLDGVSPMDSRYGIHDAQRAAKRGYHPDEALQKEYSAAVSAGAVDQSGADEKVLRKCAGQIGAKAPQAQRSPVAVKIDADSFLASRKDPAVLDVFAKWSSCMKARGYDYAEPMDARNDARFHDPAVVTDLETATATADVQCRTEHKVQKVWFDVETRLQQQKIKESQPALESAKQTNQETAKKASAVLDAQ